jgi:outer membrane immunogenic protein
MLIKRVLLTTVVLTAFAVAAHPANAADLPARPVTQAPIMSSVSVYNWTGIYVGLNGGYGFGKQDPLSLLSNDVSPLAYNANGWLLGGTFGAQIQSGHVVLGIEGDVDWTTIKGSGSGPVTKLGVVQGTGTISSDVSSISTLRTRVGYAQDNWLFYGTVGAALTKASSTFTQTVGFTCNTGNVPCSSKSDWHAGLAAGAGVEYGWTPSVSTKLEYLWIGAGAGNTLKENMMRAGVNWRFGGN